MKTFTIQKNTDNMDIREKSFGLDVWVPGDSLNLLNSNRGLHIQIRHNADLKTCEVAMELSDLISAAPDMYRALKTMKSLVSSIKNDTIQARLEAYTLLDQAIAEGKCHVYVPIKLFRGHQEYVRQLELLGYTVVFEEDDGSQNVFIKW